MKTRKDEIGGLEWYARNPQHALDGMADMNPEQRGIYNTLLDHIYLSGDRLRDKDHLRAAENNCDIRVYRRVKAYLLEHEKIALEEVDGKVFIRNQAASREVTKGRMLVGAKAIAGAEGGRASARSKGRNASNNNGTTPARAQAPAQARAQHTYNNNNKNTTDRQESPAARETGAAQPEGRAPVSTPALADHPESAVRAFAANLSAQDLAFWDFCHPTVDREGKGWFITVPSKAKQTMLHDRFSSSLASSLKNVTICAPDCPDITVT